MTKKKILSILLAAVLVFLTACSGGSAEYYGDEVDKDTLVICLDSYINRDDEYRFQENLEKLLQDIKSACGIEKIAFEVIPDEGAERSTALQRLRTEIMSGEGPDVFIMRTVSGSPDGMSYTEALFKFPEKNMEAGLFMPLDSYMENNTQFTDWDNQTKTILDAGRSDEGQVIIPLTYTFPILLCPAGQVTLPYTTDLTMQEILDDPETAELGAVMYSIVGKTEVDAKGYESRAMYTGNVKHVLGQLADYESEELLFTEEELYELVNTMYSLQDAVEASELQYEHWNVQDYVFYLLSVTYGYDEMTLVPVYSADGGVTASIRSFTAVNRNTKHPEEAFSVIDYLMCEEAQQNSVLYENFFASDLTLQNDLGSEEKPLNNMYYANKFMNPINHKELLDIKELITAVNFVSELDMLVSRLAYDGYFAGSVTQQQVSDTYKQMKRRMAE